MKGANRRSRYIPSEVIAALIAESRGRCCLCREQIVPGSERHDLLKDTLDKHHILYFSEGGEQTIENLVIVCPNCHRLVHTYPTQYPPAEIKERKQHWLELARTVPSEVLYVGALPDSEILRLTRARFRLERYGLAFVLIVPDAIHVKEFLEFITDQILRPIAEFDEDPHLASPFNLALSHRADTNDIFAMDALLADIRLESADDAFVVHYHTPGVAMPGPSGRVMLMVLPEYPREGEAYSIEFHAEPVEVTVQFAIEVSGTDGYHTVREGRTGVDRVRFRVPGAAHGVRDSIVARGEFTTLRLDLVFGSSSPRSEG